MPDPRAVVFGIFHDYRSLEFRCRLPKGDVEARDIAYLTDRILVGTGKKQKYGTQANFKDGKVVAAPIDDELHVDERREALGVEPLKEYLKLIEEIYTKPQKGPCM